MIKYPVVLIIKKTHPHCKSWNETLQFVVHYLSSHIHLDTNGLTDKMANVVYILLFVWVLYSFDEMKNHNEFIKADYLAGFGQ